MPGRIVPLVDGEIYHVFNRGINRQPTFTAKKEYQRAIQTIRYYRVSTPPLRLSKFLELEKKRQIEMLRVMELTDKLVQVIAYCLMPNHFHFLLRQTQTDGISKFLGNFQNSYTRYFNTRNQRDGSLFLDQFKAVRIETEEQLVHVCRYIHLNPYTSFVVKEFSDLEQYPWSSFSDYLQNNDSLVEPDVIMGLFKNTSVYKKFVFDQADYQRSLKEVGHLLLE